MSLADIYCAGLIGGAIGDAIGNKFAESVQKSAAVYRDSSAVNNMRSRIYETKKEIAPSAVTREILNAVLGNPSFPPKEILICAGGAVTSPIEENMRAYTPGGTTVYVAQNMISYEMCAALCLMIQDMYPDTYEINKVTMAELTEQLTGGNWFAALEMKKDKCFRQLTPAFTPDELYNKPIDQIPFSTKDPLKKNRGVFLALAFLCAALCVVLSWVVRSPLFGLVSGAAAVVFSVVSIIKASKFGIFPIIITGIGIARALIDLLANGRLV